MIKTVKLKEKADRSPRRRHPWVFSGAVAAVDGQPETGDLVRVTDVKNEFLAWGHYKPEIQDCRPSPGVESGGRDRSGLVGRQNYGGRRAP